jgi:cyclase
MAEQNPKLQIPGIQPMAAKNICGNIWQVEGGAGANTGFYSGKDSVLAVDAKMTAEAGSEFYGEIRKITDKPVTTMILTHSDHDHVNGLSGFPEGMRIISHDKTRLDMREEYRKPQFETLRKYLPTEIFVDSMTLDIDDESVNLIHFEPAHTGGDILVYFTRSKVVFTGDLVTFGRDPLIHRHKGGSSYGLVRYLKGILTLDAGIFVCGHNNPCGKEDIRVLAASIEMKQRQVEELFKQGKSIDEVKLILKVEERPLSSSGVRFPPFVESIYEDLKGGRI